VQLGSSLLGDALTLIAAACWALYVSFGAPVLRRHSPLQTTAWAMAGGSLVLAIPGLLQATGAHWADVQPSPWGGLPSSALIPAGVSNVVVFHAIRLLGPTRITALQFLVPFATVVIAFLVLSEPIRTEQLIGGAVIVAGVAITRFGRRAADLVDRLRDLLP